MKIRPPAVPNLLIKKAKKEKQVEMKFLTGKKNRVSNVTLEEFSNYFNNFFKNLRKIKKNI